MSKSIQQKQQEDFKKDARKAYELIEMAKSWYKFVVSVQEYGYDDYLVEYDNDISVRIRIERILNQPIKSGDKDFEKFTAIVFEADR